VFILPTPFNRATYHTNPKETLFNKLPTRKDDTVSVIQVADILFEKLDTDQGLTDEISFFATLPPAPLVTEGHFLHEPIIPAFAQLEWILELSTSLSGHMPSDIQLEDTKFLHTLRPPCCIKVVFTQTSALINTYTFVISLFSLETETTTIFTRGRMCSGG
jgi:3-hydroxymyristoyl/3-hydroxydecanoyl-(acyl carrier protein) dehydratase